MTQGFCTDKAALIGYLYDDCEPGERDRIAAHVADCPDCTTELASLSAMRRQLAAWVPPQAALGFQIDPAQMATALNGAALKADAADRPPFGVIEGGSGIASRSARPVAPWWKQPLPAWAQAAAAAFIFAAGVGFGVGNGAPASDSGRESTQAQSGSSSPQQSVSVTPVVATMPAGVAVEDFARLEEKLRAMQAELAALRASSSGAGTGHPVPGGADSAPTFTQVQELVAASELRVQDQMVLLDRAVQSYVQQVGNMLPPADRARAQFNPGESAALSRPAFGLVKRASLTR